MTYTDPLRFFRDMQKELRRDENRGREVTELLARKGREDFQELLSGDISLAKLRAENHPYGYGMVSPSGRPRHRRRPLPINKQSGRLYRSISVIKVTARPGSVERSILVGDGAATYALLPAGTKKMRPRGLIDEVEKRWRQRVLGVNRMVKS